jgi:predicted nuclease of predicted toxin-antitoxin system
MKILLDECIPRKLRYSLPDHDCHTVPDAGLAGKKNGFLLDLAEKAGFEIFVTMDKGLAYQQNLAGRSIAILILRGKSNRLADLLPLAPEPPESHEAGAKRRDYPYRPRRTVALSLGLGAFTSNGRASSAGRRTSSTRTA